MWRFAIFDLHLDFEENGRSISTPLGEMASDLADGLRRLSDKEACDAHLAKPVKSEELIRLIERLTARS